MNRILSAARSVVLGTLLAAASAVPASAGWKVVPASEATQVAKSALTVTPTVDWNRNSSRPVKQSEVWTLDGTTLNELYFVGGLAEGQTLMREVDKKANPLPKLKSTLLATEIPEFFEGTLRTALGTSVFEIENVEPATFAGQPGVKFAFSFATQGDALVRKGIASGAMIGGKLYLMSFIAPSIHYFDRDRAKAEALFASSRLGG